MKILNNILYNIIVILGIIATIVAIGFGIKNTIAINENQKRLIVELENHSKIKNSLKQKIKEYEEVNAELDSRLNEHNKSVSKYFENDNQKLIDDIK